MVVDPNAHCPDLRRPENYPAVVQCDFQLEPQKPPVAVSP